MLVKGIISLQLLVCALAVASTDFHPEWHVWKATHNKVYKDHHEELKKHVVWKSNKEYIERHNAHSDKFGYTLEMNKFGDMTNAEFVNAMMCVQAYPHGQNVTESIKQKNPKFKGIVSEFKMPEAISLPETVDWREGGAVTKVKDQLRCGSSYAFATIGTFEGAVALSKNTLTKLSPQNIVDCSIPFGNHGCACGDVANSYMYVIENGGLNTAKAYPYKAMQQYCAYKPSDIGASAKGFVTVKSGDERSLQAAVATAGPIAVCVDGSSNSYRFYKSGVFNVPSCSRTILTHALLLIGYGTENGKDYWLLKNSWGPHWGISGYIKMSRGKYNQCGIATYALFPTL